MPKFLRNTLDITDIAGASTKVIKRSVRDPIGVSDIFGTAAGTTPRSFTRKKLSKKNLVPPVQPS